MDRAALVARIEALTAEHARGVDHLAMVRGAVAELRRLLAELDKEQPVAKG